MKQALAAALAAGLLALSGCTDDVPAPGEAKIDVDTPALRQLKADAGIEDCVATSGDAVDDGLPDVTLPCLGGGADVDLGALRGPMVVNLWAAWCGPCVKEMPAVADFYDLHGDRVPVLGVDYEDPQTESALQLAQESGVTYPLVADTQGDLRAKGPFPAGLKIPVFAFVAEDGTVSLEAGGIDSADELVDLAEKHLGVEL